MQQCISFLYLTGLTAWCNIQFSTTEDGDLTHCYGNIEHLLIIHPVEHVRKKFKIWDFTWFELTVLDMEVHALSESSSAQFCLPYGLVTNSTHCWLGSQAGCLWNCHTSHRWQCLSICLLWLLCQLPLIHSCSCTISLPAAPAEMFSHPVWEFGVEVCMERWFPLCTNPSCMVAAICISLSLDWSQVHSIRYLEPGTLYTGIDQLHCYNTSFYWFVSEEYKINWVTYKTAWSVGNQKQFFFLGLSLLC